MKHRLTEGEAIERLFWTVLFVSLLLFGILDNCTKIFQ